MFYSAKSLMQRKQLLLKEKRFEHDAIYIDLSLHYQYKCRV